jgi:gamma-glutamyl-gamma-aminobutyrate hydrolase PuuD
MPITAAVGVSQRLLPPTVHGEVRLALDVRWSAFLDACGLIGVPLPIEPRLADAVLDHAGCIGIVLTGGDDLAELGGSSRRRDHLERHLLARALTEEIPLLGVCRGMQLILAAFGTSLVEVEGHVGTHHAVSGRMARTSVNSFHRWAACDVPDELEVLGRCEQVVEAVRVRQARAIGVMWHPERNEPFHPSDLEVFDRMFGAAL